MAGGGRGFRERMRRAFRMVYFVAAMLASLVVVSSPVLVAVADTAAALTLASVFAIARCSSSREHVASYGFRSSLMDVPVISLLRSFLVVCVHSVCEWIGCSQGLYLGAAALCSIISLGVLLVKVILFTPTLEFDPEAPSHSADRTPNFKKSWGMLVIFLSSLLFALGHVVVAYRTCCSSRRKILLHMDPETVLSCKSAFSGYSKVPRSPTPYTGKGSKRFLDTNKSKMPSNESYRPMSMLADIDSLFINCQGLTIHYKLCLSESPKSLTSALLFSEPRKYCSPRSISPGRFNGRPSNILPKSNSLLHNSCPHHSKSLSNQFPCPPLHAPLLDNTSTYSLNHEIPVLSLNVSNNFRYGSSAHSLNMDFNLEQKSLAVVLVHGFGGGVFSWRHVLCVLSRQTGCTVVAYDRPGSGLTSRPRRKDWEDKELPNPYALESQVDLLISFCMGLGISSVVLVGHDDGALLAVKAAERIRASCEPPQVDIKGVALLCVNLSREVIPAFARILLHTTRGKKYLVRRLLRTEIIQVINRNAWHDASKLTQEVLNLYKAPMFVEGWDEALHEIGRLSSEMVLSPHDAGALLKSIADIPVLVVAGANDTLVSEKSARATALKLLNSRLVSISECGHLPHEECPKALLQALVPFINKVSSSETIRRY